MKRSRAPSTATKPATHRSTFAVALVIAVVSACAEAEPTRTDDILASGEKLYSQFDEELIIRHFFRDKRDGFFVDIGCYHWKKISTTYYLEKHLNWSGIGVDAMEHLGTGWKKNRPRSRFFAYAVTDESDETITFYQSRVGLGSVELESIREWQRDHPRFDPEVVEVPTITMNDLLDRAGVEKIDFLSMDINGGEKAALAGFDIERFRPDLVHIEVNPRNRPAVAEYFEKNGYERIDDYLEYDHINWYYKPRSQAASDP